MRTIIYVNGLEKYPDRQLCSSVKAYGAKAGWNVQSVRMLKSAAMIGRLKSLWNPDGFVVNCGAGLNNIPISAFGGTPVVFFDNPRGHARPPGSVIFHDPEAIGRLAARELLSIGLTENAFVGWFKRIFWSERRRNAFTETVAAHGGRTHFFDTAELRGKEENLVNALSKWLKVMKKPMGIFAANDVIASAVASACVLANLSIPDDIAVIGVDNDVETCETSHPTLTSIALDYFAAGQKAATKLDSFMSDGNYTPDSGTPTLNQPSTVVIRKSTRRFASPDKIVSDAMELIRREACSGLTAKDVLKLFPCSRRSAEYRFRAAAGHSILDEIRRIRLETAKNLLKTETSSIDYIASRCGYESLAAFSMFFRSETGVSPSKWRQTSTPHANHPF